MHEGRFASTSPEFSKQIFWTSLFTVLLSHALHSRPALSGKSSSSNPAHIIAAIPLSHLKR